ncbi:hypothetical protein JCM8097_007417 [Rhodosporidiobolus ruineniae]
MSAAAPTGPPSVAVIAAALQPVLLDLQVFMCSTVLNAVILGIFLSQVVSFFHLFRRDHWGYKALVVGLTILELAYCATITSNLFIMTTDTLSLGPPPSHPAASVYVQKFLIAGVTWVVEGYFTFICVRVAETWLVRGVAVALWVVEFCVFLVWNVLSVIQKSDTMYELYVLRVTGVWSLFAIAAYTSTVLVFNLIVKREFKPETDVLTQFAQVAVGTSGLLALIQFVGAIGTVFRYSNWAFLMGIFLSNLYTVCGGCCVLYNLNHRATLRRGSGQTSLMHSTGHPRSGLTRAGLSGGGGSKWSGSGGGGGGGSAAHITVTMEETREVDWAREGEMETAGLDGRAGRRRNASGRVGKAAGEEEEAEEEALAPIR